MPHEALPRQLVAVAPVRLLASRIDRVTSRRRTGKAAAEFVEQLFAVIACAGQWLTRPLAARRPQQTPKSRGCGRNRHRSPRRSRMPCGCRALHAWSLPRSRMVCRYRLGRHSDGGHGVERVVRGREPPAADRLALAPPLTGVPSAPGHSASRYWIANRLNPPDRLGRHQP